MFCCTCGDPAALAGHTGCLCYGPEIQSLARRISADLSRRRRVAGFATSIASLGLPKTANAEVAAPVRPIVFTNFRLFDGKSGTLCGGLRLLVEGNGTKALAEDNSAAPDGGKVIDCDGRVVMPGLIDAHWHSMSTAPPLPTSQTAEIGYNNLAASAEAERTCVELWSFETQRRLS
jgi:hypothetical protein